MEGNTSSHQVIGICYALQQQQTQLLSVKDLNYLKPELETTQVDVLENSAAM